MKTRKTVQKLNLKHPKELSLVLNEICTNKKKICQNIAYI